ncbi:MAG TPA: glycerol-3-phosphate 1-O-acyltransferase [Desulfobulbaceae bacterium]|nr:glycerol-3-phosphate 1-O-acyltransferase [Desulfobulbaceae bacterium]
MSLTSVFLIIGSYLVGAVPFGLLLSRSSGIDIRTQGSCNIGATNVARLLGKKMGILTLLLDVAKGFFPMFLTALIIGDGQGRNLIIALSGAATVVGHMYPVYLGFKGGKGVATGLGVFLYLAPLSVLFSLLLFIVAVALSGFVSLGSLLASAAIPLWLFLLGEATWKILLSAFIGILIWFKHVPNIKRLLAGTEKSWKKRKKA